MSCAPIIAPLQPASLTPSGGFSPEGFFMPSSPFASLRVTAWK